MIVWVDELLASSPYLAPANTTAEHFSPGGLELAGCRVMVEAQSRFGAVADDAVGVVVDPNDPECASLAIERAFDLGDPHPTGGRAEAGAPFVFGDLRFYGLVPNPGGEVEGSYVVSGLTCIEVQ